MESIDMLLKKNNLRVTPQRKAILQILFSCKGHHLDVENIYELLHSKEGIGKKTGLATVYRAMDLFEKIGLVSRLSMEGAPSRYELVVNDNTRHHHLICMKCGKVQEIDDKLMENLKTEILRGKDFQMADKPMKIYGYCNQCKVKNRVNSV